MEHRFDSKLDINAARLLARYTPKEMRRSELLFDFLNATGIETPSRDQREEETNVNRIHNLLSEMSDSPHTPLLQRFHASLDLPNRRGQLPKPKSQPTSLKAACGLIETAGENDLSQAVVEAYLRVSPGQRAALSGFIGFLKRDAGVQVSLPASHRRKSRHISRRDGDFALKICLDRLETASSFIDLPAAAAGALIGLLGLPLADVARLRRQAITIASDGSLVIDTPDGRATIDPRIEAGFQKYLVVRDNQADHNDAFLLPGRPTHQHVNEGTISARLKSWGAPVRVLSISGRNWIKQQVRAN